MSFVLSLGEIRGGEKVGEIYVRGDEYQKDGKNLLIFKGETYPYNMTYEELFNHISQKGVYTVKEIKGEFFVIFYDNNSKKIYVANDRLGRETLFCFHNEKDFIISDDFWEIINLIEPDASDIDAQSVKEKAVFRFPLFYKTIVKNLNFFPPASIGEFSLADRTFKIKQYWDFRLQADNNLTIEESIERIDSALDSAMKQIKEKNALDATYGVGLSGGLDSRLVAYYALKHDMNLRSFIIGERRPHKFILSRDHSNARKLAKYFNLDHSEVEYDNESFEDKSFYDVRYSPLKNSNFFITTRTGIPEFDILLTGAFGVTTGADVPNNVKKLNKEELLDTIIRILSPMYVPKKRNIISKLLGLLLKLFFRRDSSKELVKRKQIDGIINESEFMEAKNKINRFIEENSDKSNVEIFIKYELNFGPANKHGAFESLQDWKKSYSIYCPFLLDEILNLKPEFLIERRIVKELIINKFPELAKIKAQQSQPALFYRNKSFTILRKVFAFAAFVVRGGGVVRYKDWAWGKRYQEYSHRILSKDSKIFNSIFDVEKIMKLGKEDIRLYENLVKIKQVLDLIETKGYKYFLNSNGEEGRGRK